MAKLNPTENRIVVRPDADTLTTDGGLALPESSRRPACTGVVESVGPGLLCLDGSRAPMQVRVGDRVVFSIHAGEELDLGDGRAMLVLRESDVQGVVEPGITALCAA